MTYNTEEKTKIKNSRRRELIDLWLNSKCVAEFWLQQPIKIPDATTTELRCFKIHWLRKQHPFLYYACWIFPVVLLFLSALVMAIFSIPPNLVWFGGFSLYLIVSFVHISIHGPILRTIAWHESGEPDDEAFVCAY